MEFSPRELAFLEHTMEEIKDDSDRDGEERHVASSVFGKVEGEIEWRGEQKLNGTNSEVPKEDTAGWQGAGRCERIEIGCSAETPLLHQP